MRIVFVLTALCLLGIVFKSRSSSSQLESIQRSTEGCNLPAQSAQQMDGTVSVTAFDTWERTGSPLRMEYARQEAGESILPIRHFLGLSELPVVETFEWILRHHSPAGPATLVLDVGANTGFFSSAAGLLGYRVVAFEPQPGCIPWIVLHAHRNKVSDRVCILNAGVGATAGVISVASAGCNPGYITANQIHQAAKAQVDDDEDNVTIKRPIDSTRTEIAVTSLAPFLSAGEIVPIVKIDTEGAEIGVLESLDVALREHRVRNVLVELAPHVWAEQPSGRGLFDGYLVLRRIIVDYGYRLKALDDGESHSAKVAGESPFGDNLAHLKWYDVPVLLPYLQQLAQEKHGDNVLLTLDFM